MHSNIMVHAGLAQNGSQGYTTWHIFKADDVEGLRDDVTKHETGDILGDDIHNQQTFLSLSLQQPCQNHGICPYAVQQHTLEIRPI